ncbi:MAG: branched-chain amino acid ABC transporter permease [Acidimicrobiia bacterium]|nr:branched-chain amino acid ABC transporter permease [Acidimicrobiia bacterium]
MKRALTYLVVLVMGPALFALSGVVPLLSAGNLVVVALHGLAAIGLSLIMGLGGQISLGHAAFYGVGAYTSAILTGRGVAPVVAMLAGMVLAGVLAAIVGRIVLRIRGHFLAMATLAFGLIFFFTVRAWDALTGGNAGLGGIPDLALGPLILDNDRNVFFVTWAILVLGLVLAGNLVDSRQGRAVMAMGQSEVAATSSGVDLVRSKVIVFSVGAVYAAVAGSLYAHWVNYISPEAFDLLASVRFLVIASIGGLGSMLGAPVGSLVIVIITELTRTVVPMFVPGATGSYEVTLYGIALVAVLVLSRDGITGAFRRFDVTKIRTPAGNP